MFFFDFFLSIVGVLVSVAFLTLVERKVMSYSQFRKGPSKISFLGIFQPFSDAVKLFSKGLQLSCFSMFYFFFAGPFFGLFFMVFFWFFFPSWFLMFSWNLEVLLFFCMLGLIPYFLFFCGFSSTSVFSLIGYVRSVCQSVSYEVCMILFIFLVVYSFMSLCFYLLRLWESGLSFIFFFPFLWFMWIFLSLSESNRTPFDFSEGESELVSGFNVEYFGSLFSVIFITEYGMIIFMSLIGSILFFGSCFLIFSVVFFSLVYIWVRCSYPRFRYDKLMKISWLSIMPIVVTSLVFTTEFFM